MPGTIHFNGQDATFDSVRDRRVGFVFQHYALFRHMSVFENVAFGLRVRPRRARLREPAIRDKVRDLLALVQLDTMADRFPSQLSGGQRQRVALARALAVEPAVLLLDEPFGALDAKVRKELRRWLRRLHDDLHVTSVFVTHDQEEALEVADRVVIMNHGRVEQIGSPEEVYATPASAFVIDFLGDVNLFHCRIDDGRVFVGSTPLDVELVNAPRNGVGTVYARPHILTLEREPSTPHAIPATIVHVTRTGPIAKVDCQTASGDSARVDVAIDRFDAAVFTRGARVFLRPEPSGLLVVPGQEAQPDGNSRPAATRP